jgi:catechol 2,3-dioxygenase-like lactoylglutathione lyase family enzyme
MPKSAAFYEERLHLHPLGRDAGAAHYAVGNANYGLRLQASANDGLHSFSFTVHDEDDLAAIVARAANAGVTILERGGSGRSARERRFAALQDPDGNRVELVVRDGTIGDRGGAETAIRKLGHLVLWTIDVERMEAFYSILGMRLSDRTHLGMSFLRCNDDHHSLGLAKSATGRTGLQHAALDVTTEERVRSEHARLAAAGVACVWGPGRHGPGNNIFTYYSDPGDNLIELYGDMERVPGDDRDIDVRYWGPEHRGDISGAAGPPPTFFRL